MPTLDSILELDLQVYIDRHMEEYDTEKLKWSTCEMDEWVKGADGAYFDIMPGVVAYIFFCLQNLLVNMLV